MHLFRFVAVFLLLTVWMTAKEHCNLETLGWLPDSCATKCADACESNDGCDVVESASYKQAVDHVHVAPPTLLHWMFSAPVPEETDSVLARPCSERESSSLKRVRTWQFVERAALPVRAPALNV